MRGKKFCRGWVELSKTPPPPPRLGTRLQYHLHPCHHFLSTWDTVRLGKNKSIRNFVGGELSFLKLGSVLSWGCVKFVMKANTTKFLGFFFFFFFFFEIKCVFWPSCRPELKWSQDKCHLLYVCFDDVVRLHGGANFYCSCETKNFCLAFSSRITSSMQTFVNQMYTLTSPIHPSTRFRDLWLKVVPP